VTHRTSSRARLRAGFSFIEILVVMGIIAVLVGLGVGIYTIVIKKAPITKTNALLSKMRSNIELWKGRYRAYPPSTIAKLPLVLGTGLKVGKPTPSNVVNEGIEAVHVAMLVPGFGHNPDIDSDRVNTDEDALDKPMQTGQDPALWEIKDAWGNPLVYFTDADYGEAEKNPPTYLTGTGDERTPKPWKAESGSFAQANGVQLFSLGPDGEPNTDDDLKAWSND
jgi:prepilin-type N-terminal cleavage/methylation domain-containing protein